MSAISDEWDGAKVGQPLKRLEPARGGFACGNHNGTYWCTRRASHKGQHVATGTALVRCVLAVWPNP